MKLPFFIPLPLVLVLSLLCAAAIPLPPPIFKVRCPRCSRELVQPPATIKTNKVESVLEGVFIYRDLTFKCPGCKTDFAAKSRTLIPDVIAEQVPFSMHRSGIVPEPQALPWLTPIAGASNLYLLHVRDGTKIESQPMGMMTIEQVSGIFNTNAGRTLVITVTTTNL